MTKKSAECPIPRLSSVEGPPSCFPALLSQTEASSPSQGLPPTGRPGPRGPMAPSPAGTAATVRSPLLWQPVWGTDPVSPQSPWPQGRALCPGLDGTGAFCARVLHFQTAAATISCLLPRRVPWEMRLRVHSSRGCFLRAVSLPPQGMRSLRLIYSQCPETCGSRLSTTVFCLFNKHEHNFSHNSRALCFS